MKLPKLKQVAVNVLLNGLVFVGIVWGLARWQSRNLLPDDGKVTAPHFTLPTLAGSSFELGGPAPKSRVLYFFAPWCSICGITSATMEALHHDNDAIEVIGVALSWQNRDDVADYVKNHHLTMPVLVGDDNVMNAYQIEAFPTIYFLDAKGYIKNRVIGYTSKLGVYLRL